MATVYMYIVYLFLLVFCIDAGDGLWRRTDREILQRDIKLYKKIAERVEHELQEFYTDHEGYRLFNFNLNRKLHDSKKKIPNRKLGSESNGELLLSKLTKVTNDLPIYNNTIYSNTISTNRIGQNNSRLNIKSSEDKWPKFEDILLAIGKKYDWKNDRWIKVKEKFKSKDNDLNQGENSIMFHEKHRFNYRTIKLNRGKNKRNVVIAVTAIR